MKVESGRPPTFGLEVEAQRPKEQKGRMVLNSKSMGKARLIR